MSVSKIVKKNMPKRGLTHLGEGKSLNGKQTNVTTKEDKEILGHNCDSDPDHVIKHEMVIGPEILPQPVKSIVIKEPNILDEDKSSYLKIHYCEKCEKIFKTERALSHHKAIHNKKDTQTCKLCNKICISMRQLQKHLLQHVESESIALKIIANQNSKDKRSKDMFNCQMCHKIFYFAADLQHHILNHRDVEESSVLVKQYYCEKCAKCYQSQRALNRHLVIHKKQNALICKLCGEICVTIKQLQKHLLHHIEREYVSSKTKIRDQNSENKRSDQVFSCEICNKNFTMAGNLKRHILNHRGVKEFKCNICRLRFTRNSHLKEHYLIHSKDRPFFVCDICNKRFTRKYILITHLRQHNNKKPFSCNICKKKFLTKWNLKVHSRQHL